MSDKACPACNLPFVRLKQGGCPHCKAKLYLPSSGSRARKEGIVLLATEKECADKIVDMIVEHIQKRDRAVFPLTFQERNRELLEAYKIVVRARQFLSVNKPYGWTTETFAIDLVEYMIDKYSDWVKNLYQIKNKLRDDAMDMWRKRRDTQQRTEAMASSYIDLRQYSTGTSGD